MNGWYEKLAGRYSALLTAALVLFVFEPLLTNPNEVPWGLSAVTFLLLLGSLRAVWRSRGLLWAVTILGSINLGAEALEPFERAYLPIATDVFGLAFLAVTSVGILLDIFDRDEVTVDTVFGASAVYLLIGLIFARVFLLIAHFEPGAFAFSDALQAQIDEVGLRDTGILHYFSLITLTTVGFGDVSPVTPLARNLAAVEAVVAQLYIAAVIARLVAAYTSNRD